MMNELISVVIPCYNVEKYIQKCLGSVLGQSYENLEIIAINDGSTDATTDILKSFALDRRVRIIEQTNAGVSAARNLGIELSSGQFITFVDSDDWLEPTMYERLCDVLVSDAADIAVCNYNLVYDDRLDEQYGRPYSGAVDVYDDVYAYFCKYCACPKPNNYIWTRLYKTDLVKNSRVRFENYNLADDTLFNFMLLPYVKRITWIPDGFYNYYQRTNSNVYTAARKHNLASVYADTFDALTDYYTENRFTEFLEVLPIHAFTRLRSMFFYSRLAGISEEDIKEKMMTGFSGRKIIDYLTGKV